MQIYIRLIHPEVTVVKRQKTRRLLGLLSLLAFPVTLYYFSPVLILQAGYSGKLGGSFFVFLAQFAGSVFLGRLFCGWVCPGGGLQDAAGAACDSRPKQGWRNYIKYGIWAIWLLPTIAFLIVRKASEADFFYETAYGISVAEPMAYAVYFGILAVILIPALFAKRAFCHYFCWMAPFMAAGTWIRRKVRLPGLHMAAKPELCISCGKCASACPMCVGVPEEVKKGRVASSECILCGACADGCPAQAIGYRFGREKGDGK